MIPTQPRIEPEQPRGTSAAAIRHHYDAEPAFFALWLDPTLCYSCGLWDAADAADDLERAQLRKLDHHAARARVAGARRVLDIGCGFGGLMRRMVDVHAVAHVVGLTLSATQARAIAGWDDPRCEVRIESWEVHRPAEPYDAIVSVGALEHAARAGMRSADKVAAYRRFFERCHAWLRPGARLSLQAIAKGNTPLDREAARDNLWILEHVYPESDTPRLCEVMQACERLFEVIELRNDRRDYARTCQVWLDRLVARRGRAVALTDAATVALFERYLQICVTQFERGHSTLLRGELLRV